MASHIIFVIDVTFHKVSFWNCWALAVTFVGEIPISNILTVLWKYLTVRYHILRYSLKMKKKSSSNNNQFYARPNNNWRGDISINRDTTNSFQWSQVVREEERRQRKKSYDTTLPSLPPFLHYCTEKKNS